MTARGDTTTPDVLALLPLPDPAHLTEQQVCGRACLWCKTRLSGDSAIDLGERTEKVFGCWFPRTCRTCAGVKAHDALSAHAAFCELCIENAAECGIGRALTHLVQEGRNAEATAP